MKYFYNLFIFISRQIFICNFLLFSYLTYGLTIDDLASDYPPISIDFLKEKLMRCELKIESECVDLGLMYHGGNGVKKDKVKAVYFYQKACDSNNLFVCSAIGEMYAKGDGIKKNIFKAFDLFKKACDGGYGISCSNLGLLYLSGEGVRLDKSKALDLFGKGCDLKDETSCKNYATLKNQGVK